MDQLHALARCSDSWNRISRFEAFDKIAQATTINASIVAGGIKVALITTVSGLVVAIIPQIFYNYILSKIDASSSTWRRRP